MCTQKIFTFLFLSLWLLEQIWRKTPIDTTVRELGFENDDIFAYLKKRFNIPLNAISSLLTSILAFCLK